MFKCISGIILGYTLLNNKVVDKVCEHYKYKIYILKWIHLIHCLIIKLWSKTKILKKLPRSLIYM